MALFFLKNNYAQDDTALSRSQLKGAVADVGGAQKTSYNQPAMMENSQAREADIRVLSEMTRALDKKVINDYHAIHYNFM